MELIQYRCPGKNSRGRECNHRLFDGAINDAAIEIKCPKCGNVQVFGRGDVFLRFWQEKHELKRKV